MKFKVLIRGISVLYITSTFFTLLSVITGNLDLYVQAIDIPRWFYIYCYIAFIVYLIGFIGIFRMKFKSLVFITFITIPSHPILMSLNLGNTAALFTDITVFSLLYLFFYLHKRQKNKERIIL